MVMKLSYYTIIVENFPVAGEHLVYNTRTQALVKVDQPLRDLLNGLGEVSNFPQRVRYAHELFEMHQMGLIVQNKEEDQKKIADFFRSLKSERIERVFQVTILTTMACNFQCVYCFEEGTRQNDVMSLDVCEAVISWIQRRMEALGYEGVHMTFYGGEPLLNELALEHIARAMKNWCMSKGLAFKFSLQTNGYLLTTERVEKYKKLGLSEVRISLDGVKEYHDRNRPLRGGGKTFDRIMENIIDNADRVKIGLSVSYDKNNVQNIEQLLDYLEGLNMLRKLGKMVCSPVHASLGPKGHPESIRHSHCLMNYNDDSMAASAVELDRIMTKKGLPGIKGLPISVCSVGRRFGCMTIDPRGSIYACNAMIGHPQFAIGDVGRTDFNDNRKIFLEQDPVSKCPIDCRYLPVCNGGCRLMAFLERQNFDEPYCKKSYLDQMAPELIKKEYLSMARGPDG